MSLKRSFTYISYIFFLYILAFQPPLIDKNVIVFLQLFHFILLCVLQRNYFNKFIYHFRFETNIIIILLLYVILRDLFSGDLVYADRFLAWSFQGFFYSFAIIASYENTKKKYKLKLSIFELLLIVSIIAGALSLILILNPSFDSIYASISKMDEQEFYHRYDIRHRYYGVSDSLGYGYSYLMGFFAGFSFMYLLKGKIYYIIPFILSIIAVWFNARIGFVAILIFIAYSFIFTKIKVKNIILATFMFLIIFQIYNYYNVENLLFNTMWVAEFFYEFSDLILGTNYLKGETTTSVLLGRFIILPDTISQWIFGRGESLFLKKGVNSDNGFILQLNYGGLILMFILLILIFGLMKRMLKHLGWKHFFVWFFIITLFTVNTKGFLFASTPIGRILFFLYVMYIYKAITTNTYTNTYISNDTKYVQSNK